MKHKRNEHAGFTLIEVMITAAIIAILMAIALPSYNGHMQRSNRAAAASYLLELANMQERRFLERRAYAVDIATLGVAVPAEIAAKYTITVAANNAATPPTYTLSAAPAASGGQTSDACGTLTLNSRGEKGHAAGATRCWD
ncbi:MAG: type IV pilin protein [Spongiibacter sp.]|nr:type IV pilin protein [Spongiibacter sp.]